MKKLYNKGFSAVEVLIVLVLLGAIGAVGWTVYQRQNKTETPKAVKNQTPSEMIASIKTQVTKDIPTVKDATEEFFNGTINYKVDGDSYLSMLEAKTRVNFSLKEPEVLKNIENEEATEAAAKRDREAMKPVAAVIRTNLSDNGYQKTQKGRPSNDQNDIVETYERGNDVCVLTGGQEAGIACATVQEFEKVSKEVKPLVAVYEKAETNEAEPAAYGMLEAGTGTTSNDTYAIMSTSIAAAYFYQNNGEWVYFASSQEGISCPDTAKNAQAARAFSKVCRKPGEGL